MAKVKRSPKKSAATTNATTTTTPLKTMNGKVHKVRVNVKNMKLQTKTLVNSLETSDLPNLQKSVTPKTRLCFVKLRQTHIKDKGSSTQNNNSNTLQAQCKAIEEDVLDDANANKVNNKRPTARNKKNVETNEGTAKDHTASDEIPQKPINQAKNKEDPNNNKKILVSLDKPKNGLKHVQRPGPKETPLVKSIEKSNENDSVLTSDETINKRRCVVKIKRTEQITSKESADEVATNGLCMTPKTDKRLKRQCVVKLRRTPHLATKSSRIKKSKIPVPLTPSTTRNCVVRLQRTTVRKNSTKGENPKTTKEVIDLTTKDSHSIVPALDEVKRNNFRKLSLNQSPIRKLNKQNNNNESKKANKTTDSRKETEKEITSNLCTESEDQVCKYTNDKETKTSEPKSIENNTEKEITTELIPAQLNHVTEITRVHKLSLKKPSNKTKSIANLEVSQFKPQRNSTLLEFGFNKDTNKENQIEENQNRDIPIEKNINKEKQIEENIDKEKQIEENNNDEDKENDDTSLSKNKSASQNFANKSQEIENLLNSLEDEDENDNNKESLNEENCNDQDKDKENVSTANNQASAKNALNKSQENENILNYLIDEQENDKEDENQTATLSISKRPNKFFHRHEKNSPENILKEIQVNNESYSPAKNNPQDKNQTKNILNKVKNKTAKQTIGATKKRGRFQTKRSSLPKRDNVYDFLSQSQTSDSDGNKHLDPAADIIKRLIAQGRVRVATNCKGKGRPIIKRKARNKQQPTQKMKKNAANKKEKLLKNKPINREDQEIIANNENQDHIDNDDHFMDDFDYNDEPLPEVETAIQKPQDQGIQKLTNQNNHSNEQEGTFSRLARSVLINQAGRSDLQRQKAKRLLEMAKKFVSTPKNKKISLLQESLHSDLSPIPMPPPRLTGNASPWRVTEEANLPRTFNFNTSSGNLPSFSSDFIPSTPHKDKTKNKTILQQQSIANQQPQSPLPLMDIPNSIPSLGPISPYPQVNETTPPNEPSVLSSFSSNDSNAENMPPPRALPETNNENDNIFDLKQLPNPRRTLNYRSPLKAINILEVVHLPPFKPIAQKTPQSKDTENDIDDMFGFEENLNNDSIVAENQSASTTPQKTPPQKSKKRTTQQESLFGFEDFLTQTDISSQENCNDDFETTEHRNKTIHDKLQDLRKLRPEENDLQLSLLQEKNRIPQKTLALFENDAAAAALDVNGMRQRGIKEMLCSTMIQEPQPSTSKQAVAQLKQRNLKDLQRPNFGEGSNLSELFNDPEPETTFNENDAHRTYIRPYKRKRRLKQNKFVMFFDSDESGDDEDNSAEHKKHHNSNETDTSSEKAPKKKRKIKEPKEKPELTEFIHDFNEMCKDVDSYELIVEKSA